MLWRKWLPASNYWSFVSFSSFSMAVEVISSQNFSLSKVLSTYVTMIMEFGDPTTHFLPFHSASFLLIRALFCRYLHWRNAHFGWSLLKHKYSYNFYWSFALPLFFLPRSGPPPCLLAKNTFMSSVTKASLTWLFKLFSFFVFYLHKDLQKTLGALKLSVLAWVRYVLTSQDNVYNTFVRPWNDGFAGRCCCALSSLLFQLQH